MKKCSKSHHPALAELNITPLLDLAFVLLVIFIITTTPIVNDLDIDLQSAAKRPKDPKPKINYVTVESSGHMYLNKEEVDLAALRRSWSGAHGRTRPERSHPRLRPRPNTSTSWPSWTFCQQANVGKVNLATEPFPDGSAKRSN